MKNARTKSSHLHEQQLLGASSLAAATLHTIASRGPTPTVSPDEVSTLLKFSFFHQKRRNFLLNRMFRHNIYIRKDISFRNEYFPIKIILMYLH